MTEPTRKDLGHRYIYRVTMNVTFRESGLGDEFDDSSGTWDVWSLISAIRAGTACVIDDAVSVRLTGSPERIPDPERVREVLDRLLDGEITIDAGKTPDSEVSVAIATPGQTFSGTGLTLEIALGAAVQQAVRTYGTVRTVHRHSGGAPRRRCRDGEHIWIGPVEYLDGPRLMCLHCLTTIGAPEPVAGAG